LTAGFHSLRTVRQRIDGDRLLTNDSWLHAFSFPRYPMIPRFRTAALIAAATGVPYVATQTEMGRETVAMVSNSVPSGSQGGPAHHEVERLITASSSQYRYESPLAQDLGQSQPLREDGPSIVGAPVTDLREVMRFDVTPDWVIARFSRVSTVLADVRLKALRVPIVTGTRVDDLAGTLTYYFDGTGKVQRVSMHALTGDPTRLIGAMTQHYGLTHEPTLEAGVFTKRWNGLPVHFLRLTHSSVVHADALHQKYTVFLELNQPDLPFGLSAEAKRIVEHDRMSGRW
jgi:hypothetical protein